METEQKSAINAAKLRNFFSDTGIYAHNPKDVTFIQTHASLVFIAKPWVYKIKKPVDFGFLDYSTLEKRLHYCFREVELNNRLCSEIYEGVIPIYQTNEVLKLGMPLRNHEAPRNAIEFAVKMKYLPHHLFLSYKVKNEGISKNEINRVCQKLYPFYMEQSGKKDLSKWGDRKQIKVNTDENFDQTEAFKGELLPAYLHGVIKNYTNTYLEMNADLFRERIDRGCIIDGHGDLHLDHIHITEKNVCIYDCIEFNDRLRYQDWANDLAFLAMDLDYQEEVARQNQLVTRMSSLLNDEGMRKIINFYKCYRAYVRGKIAGIQFQESESSKEKQRLKKEAERYFGLSGRYAVLGSKPIALIIMGRIATGKSTVSKQLSQLFSVNHYASDRIRKKMAGIAPNKPSPEQVESHIYSEEMSQKTYEQLLDKGLQQLNAHHSVILDATFSSANKRKKLANKLEKAGFRHLFVQTKSSDELIKKRLSQREHKSGIVSDARLEHFDKLNSIFETPEEIPNDNLISIDTGPSIDETLDTLLRKLVNHRLHEQGQE